jgi:formimidoylglutamate deiminase
VGRGARRGSGFRHGRRALTTLAIAPDLLYRDGAFQRGLVVECDGGGRIARIVPENEVAAGGQIVALRGRALLPGFVNAHSHAFQRLIRGRTQWRPRDAGADFWSWRSAMYAAANALSPEDVYEVSRFCFIEMLRAGFTAVGEFHYVHRDPTGVAYADPLELERQVLAAAEDAGIRICLLNVAYATGAIGEPLQPEQRRFATPDLDDYLASATALLRLVARRDLATAGVAPHSVRAVPRGWIRSIHAYARERDLPFHMHVSEQPAEVAACSDAYGVRPVELLADDGVADERLTAVHATHILEREIAILAATPGPTVCACPATERDLGDGILAATELVEAGARIAIGTDSQTVIAPLEEVRLVEYHERLRKLRRVVLAERAADRLEVAPRLLDMATRAGARSLRLDAGALDAGALADFIAVDLQHPALAGWSDETLPALLALCAPADVVTDVWVGGVQRVHAGRHEGAEAAQRAFGAVAKRVFGRPS